MIVQICLPDIPIHIGEHFDYLISQEIIDNSKCDSQLFVESPVGYLVEVQFGRRKLLGYIVAKIEETNFAGKLKNINQIISKVPLFDEKYYESIKTIATYYGSKVSELLGAAIPEYRSRAESQHIKIEHEQNNQYADDKISRNLLSLYPDLVERLSKNEKLAIISPPGFLDGYKTIYEIITQIALEYSKSGKTIVICVPTNKEVQRLHYEMLKYFDHSHLAILSGAINDSENFRNFLRVKDGHVNVILGTRIASFAPAKNADLYLIMNDMDGSYKDLRSPYYHAREVMLQRAIIDGCAFLSVSLFNSLQIQRLINKKFISTIQIAKDKMRSFLPKIEISDNNLEAGFRIPHRSFQAIANESKKSPVLVITPRKGYIPLLACADCREITQCKVCSSPLKLMSNNKTPVCVHCNQENINYQCPKCSSNKFRSLQTGSERTMQDFARAFPSTVVKSSSTSSASGVVDQIENKPKIVVATPGAIPYLNEGYKTIVILDANLLCVFESLDNKVDALYTLFGIVSFAKNFENEGSVIISGNLPTDLANAVIQYNGLHFVNNELSERQKLHFPPFVRIATIGYTTSVQNKIFDLVNSLENSDDLPVEVLGPFELEETNHKEAFKNLEKTTNEQIYCLIIRSPIGSSKKFSQKIVNLRNSIGLNKMTESVKIVIDPKEFC